MYKLRIKAWNLDKKLKEDDVLDMLIAKIERDAAGKSSEFLGPCGERISWCRIMKYVQRNPGVLARLHAGCNNRRNPGQHTKITCRTPPPTLTGRVLAGSVPQDERLLIAVRSYIGTSFSDGRWVVRGNGYCHSRRKGANSRLGKLLDHLRIVWTAMSRNDGAQVIQLLSSSFEGLPDILRDEDPMFVVNMGVLIQELELAKSKELLVHLLSHMTDMSSVILGATHPLHCFLSIIAGTEGQDRLSMMSRLFQLFAHEYERLPGNMAWRSGFFVVRKYIAVVLGAQACGSSYVDDCFLIGWKQRNLAQTIDDGQVVDFLVHENSIKVEHFLHTMDLLQAKEAICELQTLLEKQRCIGFVDLRLREHARSCSALLSYHQGDFELAETGFLQTLDYLYNVTKRGIGAEDERHGILWSLELLYRRMGRLEEANQKRQERLQRISALISQENAFGKLAGKI